MSILITGGAGFIGHHFIDHLLKTTDENIYVFDALTYAGKLDRLREIGAYDNRRVKIFTVNFNDPIEDEIVRECKDVSVIVHMGAETHVDNSITGPEIFVRSNVMGTCNMLQLARKIKPRLFIYFSTDEVHGPAPEGVQYKETDALMPTNPYSATKAGGEMLVRAFGNTYGIPWIITRTMNAFGERQHGEKFIPKIIKSVIDGTTMTIHSNAQKTKSGSRFYIHCRNIASAIVHLMRNGELNNVYNIVGEKEVSNLEMAQQIAAIIGKPLKYEMVDFHSSRPGHDLRYALDGSKLAASGWTPPKSFEESLEKSVKWTLENARWIS